MNSARQSIHGSPNKICWQDRMVEQFFLPKMANMLLAKKNKSFARAPYFRETIYPCQKQFFLVTENEGQDVNI